MPTDNLIQELKPGLPLALFPVRLETRFNSEGTELRVRIYPDEIHIDSFEPKLTDVEITWGQHFWEQTWLAGTVAESEKQKNQQEARQRSAWAQLAERFGSQRAAWIAKQLTPKNESARPTTPPLDGKLTVVPECVVHESNKTLETWTRAAYTKVLPDRWIALGYIGEKQVFACEGNDISDTLDVGPSPAKGLDAELFAADPHAGWLIDFDKAVDNGMGLRIRYEDYGLAAGTVLDRLLVVGIKSSLIGNSADQVDSGSLRLQELLDAHHYTHGLAFIPQGTLSNNTTDMSSGYTSQDPSFATSYRIQRSNAEKPEVHSNRVKMARALGIEDAVFAKISEAAATEQLDAEMMNTALWPSTWGYFLEQLMAGPGSPSEEAIRQGREHFVNYVRARGPLPALRIGRQPYGVLPAISLKRWKGFEGNPIDADLVAFLQKLWNVWSDSLAYVPHLTINDTNRNKTLLSILAMTPTSVDFCGRPSQRFAPISTLDITHGEEGDQRSMNLAKKLGLSWIPRQIQMLFASYGDVLPLTRAPVVQPKYESGEETYLEWLLKTASYQQIWHNENDHELKHNSILETILRHSMLQEYVAAAVRILSQRGLPNVEGRWDRELVDETSPKPWNLLTNDQVTDLGKPTIGEFLDDVRKQLIEENVDLSATSAPADLVPTLNSFAAFIRSCQYISDQVKRSPDIVEQCLRETLDLCSHRYDAWVTSFATKRLEWLREKNPKGIYFGGYGWVENLAPGPARLRIDSPKRGKRVVRITTTGVGNGLVQTFLPEGQGPSQITAGAWVCVKKGKVGIGTGNGGNTKIDAETGSTEWHYLEVVNGITPANEFIIYATALDAEHNEYAEFFISNPSITEASLPETNLLKNSEFLPRQYARPVRVFLGDKGDESVIADWRVWNNTPGRTETEVIELSEDLGSSPENEEPIFLSEGNFGFVHAPSLAQATTAAILRSGYLSRRASGDNNVLAINLSSERVRLAQWILDGVRQGQPLGALLGYRFERGLHEQKLDSYIRPFRKIAPLVAAAPENQTIDGLALLHLWDPPPEKTEIIPWGQNGLPADNSEDKHKCIKVLESLAKSLDAVSDLVIAESVHHVAQGNPVRAGASLEAIAQGEAPPPDMEVTRTPRTGIGITHRIILLFSGVPPVPIDWPVTERAKAEPFLNAWAADILGPSAWEASCGVRYFDPSTNKVFENAGATVKLSDLGLAPIDVLYLPESEGEAQGSELEQRVAEYALRSKDQDGIRPDNIPANAETKLTFARESGWSIDKLSFIEVLEAARTARRLLTSARVLNPRDFVQPHEVPSNAWAVDIQQPDEPSARPLALEDRTTNAIGAFEEAYENLKAQLNDTVAPIDSNEVRKSLMRLANFGIVGTVPGTPFDDSPSKMEALRIQADSVKQEAQKRIERAKTLQVKQFEPDAKARNDNNPASAIAIRDYNLAKLAEIFGPDFRALPRIVPIEVTDLSKSLAASIKLQRGNRLEVITWFQRVARVRDGVARLDATMLYAEALGNARLDLTVGQLPYVQDETWVALPLDSLEMKGGRLSLVILAPNGIDLTKPLAGLLIDEWVETVPNKKETTGVAFHYDAPAAEAPQTILLAVPPDDQPWNLDKLEATVLETLELAKLRAVDLTALGEVGQFLPALYFSKNDQPESIISTDFAGLSGTQKPGG